MAEFIAQRPAATLASTALELAAITGTSDATVIRTVQALGYAGLTELKQALVSSLDWNATPAVNMRRTLADLGDDAMHALDAVMSAHEQGLETLRSEKFRGQLARALPVLDAAERIVVFGIGPSAPLARYVAIMLTRVGRRTGCLDATGIGLADQLLDLRAHDVVLALAYGRVYREVSGVFAEARRLRLPIVLVSETDESRLAKMAEAVMVVPRGQRHRVGLHGGTLVALEAILLALAATDRERTVSNLERLAGLRGIVGGQRHGPI